MSIIEVSTTLASLAVCAACTVLIARHKRRFPLPKTPRRTILGERIPFRPTPFELLLQIGSILSLATGFWLYASVWLAMKRGMTIGLPIAALPLIAIGVTGLTALALRVPHPRPDRH